MKYEMIFGDEALFDGAGLLSGVDIVTRNVDDGLYRASRLSDYTPSTIRKNPIVAMRRIIKTPVWTEKDRRSKKLPPVGMIVKWVNESYTAGIEGAAYPEVGTDVLILAETDNATLSKKGVVFKWHTKHGVLTSFTTRAMDFSPIETPAEKSQRLEDEFINYVLHHEKSQINSSEELVAAKRAIKLTYKLQLSGELAAPKWGE